MVLFSGKNSKPFLGEKIMTITASTLTELLALAVQKVRDDRQAGVISFLGELPSGQELFLLEKRLQEQFPYGISFPEICNDCNRPETDHSPHCPVMIDREDPEDASIREAIQRGLL